MFDKEKRKGVPDHRLRDLIAGIAIGVVGVLLILGFIAYSQCWFMVGCNSLPPLPTATATFTMTPSSTPTFIPSPTMPPTWTPTFVPTSTSLPTLTPMPTNTAAPLLHEPYELRAFAVNANHSLIALSYWDETHGILEAWPWLDKRVGDRSAIGIIGTERPYERLMFSPMLDSLTLAASQEQDNNAAIVYFDLNDKTMLPVSETIYSLDGRWSAQVVSSQVTVYEGQNAVMQITLEAIYDSLAFSPQNDALAIASRDGNDGFYVEIYDLTQDGIHRTHRHMFTGNLTSPVVYHPEGTAIAIASDTNVFLVSLIGELDQTLSLFSPAIPIRFLAFDVSSGLLAAAGGNPDDGDNSGVYLLTLEDHSVPPNYLSRAHFIPIQDEIIGLQDVNGLLVGTRRQLAYIREGTRYWEGWGLTPILTTSNEGITVIN